MSTPGTPFQTLVRNAAEQGLVEEAKGRVDESVRATGKTQAGGRAHVQRRANRRWVQVNEHKPQAAVTVYTNVPRDNKPAEEEVREAKRKAELANELVSEQKRGLEILSTKLSKYLSPQVYSSNLHRPAECRESGIDQG